jgi:Family of unknown function (DUF5343)
MPRRKTLGGVVRASAYCFLVMPVPNSYLNSAKNVGQIFAAIKGAGVPERFTHEFLKQLGFSSSNDRSVIAVMKALRFLDDNSSPTDRYKRFRDPAISEAVMAEALRDAYADLFTVNQKANEQSSTTLVGAFKRLTDKGDAVATKMATTFKTLASLADWSAASLAPEPVEEETPEPPTPPNDGALPTGSGIPTTFPGLHHDIHLHLPESTNVKVYDAIFRSLREHLG